MAAGEMSESYARACPGDEDPGQTFEDRTVRLETTFAGAGVLSGDLTAECTALVNTVLDALSAPRGAEDDRSHAQRYHDALAEAMYRLVSAGLLPERAGQPAKVWAHISPADLMVLDANSKLQDEWTDRVRAEWAGHRAAASVAGGDGAAWLDGDAAAEGFAWVDPAEVAIRRLRDHEFTGFTIPQVPEVSPRSRCRNNAAWAATAWMKSRIWLASLR
jgi:hypothetical protein